MSATSAKELLRRIGPEAISAQTHIPPMHVRSLLNEEFEVFSRVQFSGFVTILEREYDVDLSEWRQHFDQMVPVQPSPLSELENDPFADAVRSDRAQRRNVYIFAGLLIVIIAVMVAVLNTDNGDAKLEINNTAIDKAKENLASKNAVSEINGTREQAVAIQEARESAVAESNETEGRSESVRFEDVIIRPRSKLWLGVIDAQSHKRLTRTTTEPWRLDGSKSWLIITGHGLLSLECGGIVASFAQRDRLLILYEEGKCTTIDEAEFKARNRGRVW